MNKSQSKRPFRRGQRVKVYDCDQSTGFPCYDMGKVLDLKTDFGFWAVLVETTYWGTQWFTEFQCRKV